jgi:ribonuclease T2
MRPIFQATAALAVLFASGLTAPAQADILADGTFAATKTCPAFLSFRKSTNPGDVNVEPGKSYPVISQNAAAPTHYRLRVEGASPPERWVSTDCGTFAAAAGSSAAASASATEPSPPPTENAATSKPAEFILSLSWEPAFCENHGTKAECAGETATSVDATRLSLHGLWPEPFNNQYCGVDAHLVDSDKHGDWKSLPAVDLSPAVAGRLAVAMPGTRSLLERHEWLRHGTCYGADPSTYFGDALTLLDAVNASPVQALFAANVGKEVSAADIRQAFDKGFGPGVGARVKIACTRDGDRRLISEITIGLVGKPGNGRSLKDLVAASRPTSAGCPAGIVDPVNAQ